MKKLIMILTMLGLMVGNASAFEMDRASLGIQYNATPGTTEETAMTEAVKVGGMEQFIIYSGDATTDETYAAYWYADDGTSYISKDAITVNTLSTVKTRTVIFKVTTTLTTDAINTYIYGR